MKKCSIVWTKGKMSRKRKLVGIEGTKGRRSVWVKWDRYGGDSRKQVLERRVGPGEKKVEEGISQKGKGRAGGGS